MMRSRILCSTLAMAAALVALTIGRSDAQNPILTFNEATGSSGTNQGQSVGWQFDVLSPITVTGLGWFDERGDGLGHSHTVGIWDTSGVLLASAVVDSGTTDPLVGQFRTQSIAPLLLSVGNGYVVGGENFSNSGDRLASDVAQTVDSRIRYFDATFSDLNSGFVDPTHFSVANTGFYGPSFSTGPAVAATPEFGSVFSLGSLLAASGAGLWLRRRGRK